MPDDPVIRIQPNPAPLGLPWVVSVTDDLRFVWRLFPTIDLARAAAREASLAKIGSGEDFNVTVGRMQTPLPSVQAVEAAIEFADNVLEEILGKAPDGQR